MARSMRSKRGRKLRAVKRIRYGAKELVRLKNMLAKAEEEVKPTLEHIIPESLSDNENDIQMENEPKTSKSAGSQELPSKPPKYPSWLSHFKVKKLAKQERKRKRKETKRLKKEKKMSREYRRK